MTEVVLFKPNQSCMLVLLGKIDHLPAATSIYSLLKPDLAETSELLLNHHYILEASHIRIGHILRRNAR